MAFGRAVLASAAGIAALVALARLLRRIRSEAEITDTHARILVAACDLDKTVYPPAGPTQAEQLSANLAAMAAFERVGGFVFPVTGNNPPQAQVKFTGPDGQMLRDVSKHPGIFCNGGLVLGPGGVELERQTLGRLHLQEANGRDFVTALLDFWADPSHASLTDRVGLLFFLPHALVGFDGAYSNVDAFCASQRVSPERWPRERIVSEREHVLQVVLLYPPLSNGNMTYLSTCRPQQEAMRRAMEAAGLANCATREGAPIAARGVRFTPMKDPWPEMDITVGGVDKGSALCRLLRSPELRSHLGEIEIDASRHVAVFGDAANDVPMFRSVGGVRPALRVGMPHATHHELCASSNVRAEVSAVLERCVAARR